MTDTAVSVTLWVVIIIGVGTCVAGGFWFAALMIDAAYSRFYWRVVGAKSVHEIREAMREWRKNHPEKEPPR